MALDYTQFDLTIQDKLDTATDAKELLLVAKAIEAVSVGSVADIKQEIQTLAAIDTEIVAVATDILKVTGVYDDLAAIGAVYADLTNLDRVANDLTNLDLIAGSLDNLNVLYLALDALNAVYADLSNIDLVAADLSNIDAVATDLAKVTGVYDDLVAISAVYADLVNIDLVAADLTNLDLIAGSLDNLNAVYAALPSIAAVEADLTNIDAVYLGLTAIDAVATDILKVTGVYDDLVAIGAVYADLTNIDLVAADLANIDLVAGSIDNVNAVATTGGIASSLKFGATTLTNSSTAPTTGQYLQYDGSNIVGAGVTQVTVDDSPSDGETTHAISSNWAYDHAAAANPHSTALSDVSDQVFDKAQQILHGFANRTDSTLSFDDAEHIVTLGVASSATVYLNGVAYAIASPGLTLDLDTKTLSTGLWFVWIEISAGVPVLNAAKSAWDIQNTSYTPVATVYWNGSVGAVCDERHGATRNLALHSYLHHTVGARIENDGSFAQTRPSTANDSTLELVGGSLWDEDIENVITTAQGKLCRLWYETASNTWTFVNGTDNGGYDRPYLWNAGTSRVQYPESDNSYTLADVGPAAFFPVWVYASNDITRPIYIVTPSRDTTYTNLASARGALPPVVPFASEVKLLWRWIYRGDGEYQEAADYRNSASLPAGGVTAPTAASVSFAPTDTISATNVQAAIEELAADSIPNNYLVALNFGALI